VSSCLGLDVGILFWVNTGLQAKREQVYIGGEWVGVDRPLVDVISPATEEVFGQAAVGDRSDIDRAVALAREAFDHSDWPRRPAAERIALVRRLAEEFESGWPVVAATVTAESGTPISVCRTLGGKAAAAIRAAADVGEAFQFEERRSGYAMPALVTHEPVGVVGAITPSNGLAYLIISKLAPALVAGCTVVVKSAIETPFAAYALAEACHAAGFPKGVVSILPGGPDAAIRLVEHPDVDMIAFTGGGATGQSIMAAASSNLKRLSLELGGKAAAIVLDDIELEDLMSHLVPGSTRNTGQACGLLSRIVVSSRRYDEVLNELCARVGGLVMGDPFDEKTALGPLISSAQRDRVENHIAVGVAEGARVALGGGRPAALSRGWYVEPTIFADVDPGMRIAQEEIFGPVVCVLSYEDEEEAIAIANGTPFGLSGSVFTSDLEKGRAVARRLRVGRRNVNSYGMDPGIPFGGLGISGMGREGGIEGLRQYLETSTLLGG